MRKSINGWVGWILLGVLATGCGKDPIPEEYVDDYDYSVDPVEVSPDGCLNLEIFFDKLRQMPERGRMRRYTVDFNLRSDSSIRRNFRALLTFGSFRFKEGYLGDLVEEYPVVRQTGCKEVRMGDGEVFRIAGDDEAAELVLKHEDGRTVTYLHIPPATLRVVSRYSVTDYRCGRGERTANAHLEEIMRWGSEEVAGRPEEDIDPAYLNELSRLTLQPVVDESIYREDEATGKVWVGVDRLRALGTAEIQPQFFQCYASDDPHRPRPLPAPSEDPDRDDSPPGAPPENAPGGERPPAPGPTPAPPVPTPEPEES